MHYSKVSCCHVINVKKIKRSKCFCQASCTAPGKIHIYRIRGKEREGNRSTQHVPTLTQTSSLLSHLDTNIYRFRSHTEAQSNMARTRHTRSTAYTQNKLISAPISLSHTWKHSHIGHNYRYASRSHICASDKTSLFLPQGYKSKPQSAST